MTRLRSRPRPPGDVAPPSDFAGPKRPAGVVRVGGRIVAVRGLRLVVSDALAALEVDLGSEASVVAGDLVVVEGHFRGATLANARLVETIRPATRGGDEGGFGAEFARIATRGAGARLAARGLALGVVREWFGGHRFLEVETPLAVESPGLDRHVDAVRAEDRFLVTSPELHMKRLLVGGLPRIYQIARVSRRGELGPLHEPEFTLIEWYRSFSEVDRVVQDTEELVAAVVTAIEGAPRARAPGGRVVDVTPPFPRLTVAEAFRRHAGIADVVDLAATDEDRYFQALVDRVEPALAEASRPVVLHDFPVSQAALARPSPADPTVAERFEIYAGGVELCNGFGELTDPVEQRRRFDEEVARRRSAGAPEHPVDEAFLAALAEGMPPSAGNALGFDRLLMLALGAPSIDAVVAFPRRRE